MTEKLLPCSCGKSKARMVNSALDVRGTPYSMLECTYCGYRTKKWSHQTSAIREWNEWQAVQPTSDPEASPEQPPTKGQRVLDWWDELMWRCGF